MLKRCFKEVGTSPLSSGIVNLRNKKTGYNTDDEQAAQTEYRSSSHYTRAPPGEQGDNLNPSLNFHETAYEKC